MDFLARLAALAALQRDTHYNATNKSTTSIDDQFSVKSAFNSVRLVRKIHFLEYHRIHAIPACDQRLFDGFVAD
jgi:hypothetical protein